jgi:hypothetical protein
VAASLDEASTAFGAVPNDGALRISLQRKGPHVTIGYRVDGGALTIVREVRGFAAHAPPEAEEWYLGIAANRPGKEGAEGLEVEFDRFELDYFQ